MPILALPRGHSLQLYHPSQRPHAVQECAAPARPESWHCGSAGCGLKTYFLTGPRPTSRMHFLSDLLQHVFGNVGSCVPTCFANICLCPGLSLGGRPEQLNRNATAGNPTLRATRRNMFSTTRRSRNHFAKNAYEGVTPKSLDFNQGCCSTYLFPVGCAPQTPK